MMRHSRKIVKEFSFVTDSINQDVTFIKHSRIEESRISEIQGWPQKKHNLEQRISHAMVLCIL